MRRSIERLAWMIQTEHLARGSGATLGQIAEQYGETVERVMDAVDVIKIVSGEPTVFPPVEWGRFL